MSSRKKSVSVDDDRLSKLDLEVVDISSIRPHPRNYLEHPDDEVTHLVASIKKRGLYKNIVLARDGTILAGHGVVKALISMGVKRVTARRLDLDPNSPDALEVLAGDNEVSHLAEKNDRALSGILKEIRDFDPSGLLGTGFDDQMLANLLLVTRPVSEIADFNEAAEWVGLPSFEFVPKPLQVMVSFRSKKDKQKFARLLGLVLADDTKGVWWPYREKDDPSSLKFKG